MPKLYFRYGPMGAGKTTALLVALFQYEQTGKTARLIKPAIDTRHGKSTVWSRINQLSREADIVLEYNQLLSEPQLKALETVDAVFVEESQFLHPSQVEQRSLLSL